MNFNDIPIIGQIIESGMVVVIACVVAGQLLKPVEKFPKKFIPHVLVPLGGVLGIVIPGTFPGTDSVTAFIYGAVCGIVSNLVYDYLVQPFLKKLKIQ